MRGNIAKQTQPTPAIKIATTFATPPTISFFANLNSSLEQNDNYASLESSSRIISERTLLHPVILLIGGHVGTGKTTLSRELANRHGLIHIQADAVRKHINGIDINSKASDNIYTPAKSRETFLGMAQRASLLINTGIPVVIDGTFMAPYQRIIMEQLPLTARIPMEGIWLKANTAIQVMRVKNRLTSVSDAGVNIVESMAASHDNEPPKYWHCIDSGQNIESVMIAAGYILRSYVKHS